jgi:hypothetical protein
VASERQSQQLDRVHGVETHLCDGEEFHRRIEGAGFGVLRSRVGSVGEGLDQQEAVAGVRSWSLSATISARPTPRRRSRAWTASHEISGVCGYGRVMGKKPYTSPSISATSPGWVRTASAHSRIPSSSPSQSGQRRNDRVTGGGVAGVEWSDHGRTIPLPVSPRPPPIRRQGSTRTPQCGRRTLRARLTA